MHDPRHNNHINGLLIIVAILIVGGILWFVIASSGDTYTATPTDKAVEVVENDENLYRNEEYDFSVRYDSRLEAEPVLDSDPWRFGSSSLGTRFLTLSLSRDLFPNTNFSEGLITIGVSRDQNEVANCLIAQDGEVMEGVGNGFTIFASGDAGAGNFFDVKSYRSVRGNACLALEKVIHSTNVANYDESQNVTEFDRAAVNDMLDRVISSFHFNN